MSQDKPVEATPEEELLLRRAARAELLLKDDLIVEACASIEAKWMNVLRHSDAVGQDGPSLREQARFMLDAKDQFLAELTSHVTSGTIAA